MGMSGRTRRQVSTWVIGVLLLAQWLVAAHACAGVARAPAPEVAAVVSNSPHGGCHAEPPAALDPFSTSLCKVHCDVGQQAPVHIVADEAPAATPVWFAVPAVDRFEGVGRPLGHSCPPRSSAPPGWPPLHLTLGVLRN
jgi:hypothetical protein